MLTLSVLSADPGISDGEFAPHKRGRAYYLFDLPGCSGACQRGEHTLPPAATHPHSSGNPYCKSGRK